MSEALACAYESVQPRLGETTFQQFCAAFRQWNIQPIEANGVTVGAVMANGSEIHIAIKPSAQGHTWLRSVIRKTIASVIEKHGEAITMVMDGHAVGHRLARLCGFQKLSAENGVTKYICHRGAL